MNVFIGWSGDRSKMLAAALRDLLPLIGQDINPWLSDDMAAGTPWNQELDRMLRSSNFGILCLTPENADAPWLAYEAGLIRGGPVARVVPYWLGRVAASTGHPLEQFQAVDTGPIGTKKLIESLNEVLEQRRDPGRLETDFQLWWPKIRERIAAIPGAARGPAFDGPDNQRTKWAAQMFRPISGAAGAEGIARLPQAGLSVGLIDERLHRSTGHSVAHRRADLIERLFFDVGRTTDFMVPGEWATPPDIAIDAEVFTYAHEAVVLDAMTGFFSDVDWRVATDENRDVRPADSLVCIGSGVSNRVTRRYLGDAKTPSPGLAVPGHGLLRLPYVMAYVSTRKIERLQYGRSWLGPESGFVDVNGNIVARPRVGSANQLEEDYLLVTRLPGKIFFAGLHGLGTRAAELFFRHEPGMLEDLDRRLSAEATPPAAFQAIFRATNLFEKDGSTIAKRLECMGNPCPPVRLL